VPGASRVFTLTNHDEARADLRSRLDALIARTRVEQRLHADPVGFVHRYTDRSDQEVAAVLAGSLAYGRVAAFRPVLGRLFDRADRMGGPMRWVEGFDIETESQELASLVYRWNRGSDLVLLLAALRRSLARAGTLEAMLGPGELPEALDALVVALRADAVAVAGAADFAALPRGVRTLLPRPADGSATKRWWMVMRWLIRRPTHGVDLGLWRSRRPAELVVPLDTHVLRVSQFLGWTARKDASLRTAREVTEALRTLDPVDPIRYDFALAHLGISGACRGHRDPDVCPGCPLNPMCTA